MSTLGALGLMVYALVVPGVLFQRLLRESRDEAEERFDPDFMESHGWLVRMMILLPRRALLFCHWLASKLVCMLRLIYRYCGISLPDGGL